MIRPPVELPRLLLFILIAVVTNPVLTMPLNAAEPDEVVNP